MFNFIPLYLNLKHNIMNDIQTIQSKIYEIRGYKVMLDFDLAAAYGVETAQLKRQVRRNMQRFEGDDFMFEVTHDELLRCQIGILKAGRGKHFKYLPFAFTELGVAMLSSVLRSPAAIQVNRDIMRAFVSLRHLIMLPDTSDRLERIEREIKDIKEEMNDILHDQNDINESIRAQLDAISVAFAELQADKSTLKPRRRIGFVQDESDVR